MSSRRMKLNALFVLILLAVPVMAFFVVFDTATPAYKFDEEYNVTRLVALGPRPRYLFCTPSYDIHYDGSEWPFYVFKPFCALWRGIIDYAPPK